MDKLKFRRGCALATTLCMLLTGCSLGAGSSEEKAASSVAAPSNAPAVEAPQTTASPVEQTGFGYEASGAMQVIDGAIFEKLVLLGGSPWLVTQQEDGGLSLENLDSGSSVQPEMNGTVLAACGGGGR